MELSKELPKRLRAKQIASIFSISVPTIWRYAKEGKLTRIKPSKKITLFDTDEVLKLFSNKGGLYE